jgi:hypothetical protein
MPEFIEFPVRHDELGGGSSVIQQRQPSLHLFVKTNDADKDLMRVFLAKPRRQVSQRRLGPALKNVQMIRVQKIRHSFALRPLGFTVFPSQAHDFVKYRIVLKASGNSLPPGLCRAVCRLGL